jgi:hypothetical protein
MNNRPTLYHAWWTDVVSWSTSLNRNDRTLDMLDFLDLLPEHLIELFSRRSRRAFQAPRWIE